jgi:hypothetical protein
MTAMRILIAMTAIAIASLSGGSAKADAYRWCAQNLNGDGESNCYFETLEQCKATASTATAFCTPNIFYTGPDAGTPRAPKRRR